MKNRKKKILFLTTIEFRPPVNGGTLYTFSLYKALKRIAVVDLCILKNRRRFKSETLHKAICFLRALVSGVPLNVIYHSGSIVHMLPNIKSYDLVVVDHIEAYEAVRNTDARCVLVAHNLEYMLASDKLSGGIVSWLMQLKVRLERYESKAFTKSAGIICISASERKVIENFNDNVVQILPSFNIVKRRPRPAGPVRLGFIGPASWPPNLRTLKLLVEDVFPQISRPFEFNLAGSGWDNCGVVFPPEIHQMGFISDVTDFWESIDILVSPTQQGAGVNIKICEALNAGVCVLTNTLSANAIFDNSVHPASLILADTNEDLVKELERFSPLDVPPNLNLFTKVAVENQLNLLLESL